MATATVTPAPVRTPVTLGDSPLIRTWLPLILMVPLAVAVVTGLTVVGLLFYQPTLLPGWFLSWLDITPEKQVVSRRLSEALKLFGVERNPYLWLVILIPVLLVGFFYVAWMYVRDSRSIGWPWAAFLGLVRCTVYCLLALVFLMPAIQSWDETKTQSRVVVLFDVSASMNQTRDDTPRPGQSVEDLLTRQQKVIQFLTKQVADPRTNEMTDFLKELQKKNPVFCYRFGRQLDENFLAFEGGRQWGRDIWDERKNNADWRENPKLAGNDKWAAADWNAWLNPDLNSVLPESLKPDDRDDKAAAEEKKKQRDEFYKELDQRRRLFGGTNLGEPALAAFNREAGNMVQAVVIFSDGRSNEGALQAHKELAERAKKAKVPIMVVAVGEDRPQIKIEITDLRVPPQARPEDKFPAVVEINGEGLGGKEIPVTLEVSRVISKDGKDELAEFNLVQVKPNGEPERPPFELGKRVIKIETKVTFNPTSNPPHAQAEFPLDAATLLRAAGETVPEGAKIEFVEDKESQLKFVARVPVHEAEVTTLKEHASDPALMRIVKRPLRLLLFAGAATRDYQFIRTLFVREMDKGRSELCIYMPPPPDPEKAKLRVQDVPAERLLTQFPDRYAEEEKGTEQPFLNLAYYDLIIAFDADWTKLSSEQVKMVESWVDNGGGLIFLGGPVNTVELARPKPEIREKVKPILNILPVYLKDNRGLDYDRDSKDGYPLLFVGATPEMEFLNLEDDPNPQNQLKGWELFWGKLFKNAVQKDVAERGFYGFYPVERAKDGAIVVARFGDPDSKKISTYDGKEQPFLVLSKSRGGQVVWIGWGDTWRLRMFREAYHERFWTKLARFAAAANLTKQNSRILPVHGRVFPANSMMQMDVQVLGRDLKPVPRETKPELQIKLPQGVPDSEIPLKYELGPKPGSDNGWFTVRFLVKSPGEYNYELKVTEAGATGAAVGKFSVKESNPELDNTRPDYALLYEMASDTTDVLPRLDDQLKKDLRVRLDQSRRGVKVDRPEGEPAAKGGDGQRLYLDLKTADIIPSLTITRENKSKNRGPIEDLWDRGFTISRDWAATALWILVLTCAGIAVALGALAFVLMSQKKSTTVVVTYLLITGVVLLSTLSCLLVVLLTSIEVSIAYFLLIVVGLLSVEWLTRKLLRLA